MCMIRCCTFNSKIASPTTHSTKSCNEILAVMVAAIQYRIIAKATIFNYMKYAEAQTNGKLEFI